MTDLTAEEQLLIARAHVRKRGPYFMPTIYGLVFVPYPAAGTAFVTPGMVCAYNPAFVEALDSEELAGVLAHEASHVLRDFFRRVLLMNDPELFSLASDLPINEDLREGGWKLPKIAVYAETFKLPTGKTSEEYYELLQKRNEGKKQMPTAGSVCGGACSSPSKEITQQLDEQYGRSHADQTRIVRQTFEEVKQHIQQKGRGRIPGFLKEMVDDFEKESRIDWRQRLQSIVRTTSGALISGGDDYSIRRPSKRSFVRGIIRPGLIEQQLVPFFILDTSLSMNIEQLLAGLGEAIGILEQLGIEQAWFCQVDAQVAMEPKLMTLYELREVREFKGRGGTDFHPGIEAAKSTFPRPDMIFYFTDGDGYAPKEPPGIETIWCIVPNAYVRRKPANWGHLVIMTDDGSQPPEETLMAADVFEDD